MDGEIHTSGDSADIEVTCLETTWIVRFYYFWIVRFSRVYGEIFVLVDFAVPKVFLSIPRMATSSVLEIPRMTRFV